MTYLLTGHQLTSKAPKNNFIFIVAGNSFTNNGTELINFGSELAQLMSLRLMSDEKEVVPPYAIAFTRKERSVTCES